MGLYNTLPPHKLPCFVYLTLKHTLTNYVNTKTLTSLEARTITL